VKLILAGAAEGWESRRGSRRRGVPVLWSPSATFRATTRSAVRYENAAVLAKAGVKVALLEPDYHSRQPAPAGRERRVVRHTWAGAAGRDAVSGGIFGVADRTARSSRARVGERCRVVGRPFEFTTGWSTV